MKTEYKRDLKHNYLVIELEEESKVQEYAMRMIEQNAIEGLLPVQVRRTDGSACLYYEITSRQQMDSVYERKLMRSEEIRRLLSEIQNILESARRYLLDPNHLLLDPRYLYLDMEGRHVEVCYYPGEESKASVRRLAEFVLRRLDHEDSQAVALGYGFYQRAAEQNFSLPDTLRELLAKNCGQERGRPSWEEASRETGKEDPKGDAQLRKPEEQPEEPYEVFHRERKKKRTEKRKERQKREFPVHPLILLATLTASAAVGILLYLGWLDLTEAGGALFFALAAAVLANRFWKNKREKKEKFKGGWYEEDDDFVCEEFRELKSELYQGEPGIGAGAAQAGEQFPGEDEKTRCLKEEDPKEELWLISGQPGKYPDIRIGNHILVIGKTRGQADVLLDEPTVSRIHARLERKDGRYYVRDLNSRNGTFVNGLRLDPQGQSEIREGDEVTFAGIHYRASAGDSDQTRLLKGEIG